MWKLHAPIVLPILSPSSSKYVCPTARLYMSDGNRWSGKGQLLRLGIKKLLHCAAY